MASLIAAKLPAQICAVISNDPAAKGLVTAADHGITTAVVDHRQFKQRADFDTSLAQAIDAHRPDIVVLAGFMRILKEPTIFAFADRIVNVHPSLLPKFKGSNAVQRALDAGETETGTTVHLVNTEIDGGKILAQAKVPVLVGDTAEKLHARIKQEEHKLLPQVLAGWKANHGGPV